MREDGIQRREALDSRPTDGQRSSAIIFAIVAIALLLAIGFFYLAGNRHEDRPVDTANNAALSLDDAARTVENAARNAVQPARKDR